MRKTRPGSDRITAQSLRAQVGNASHQLDAHVKQCHPCHKAGSDPYDHCSTWWGIATELHRLRRRLRRYERPIEDDQMMLPGME